MGEHWGLLEALGRFRRQKVVSCQTLHTSRALLARLTAITGEQAGRSGSGEASAPFQ